LCLVVIEYTTAILRAYIRALSVGRGWIVHLVEELDKLAVRDLLWVVNYLESFCVCGIALAYLTKTTTYANTYDLSYHCILLCNSGCLYRHQCIPLLRR
jgi:hypothetical protein